MSWEDTTRRMLQPLQIGKNGPIIEPHTTSGWGPRLRQNGTWELHKAGDFNYQVGRDGQRGVNLAHPAIRSPVAGVVTNAGQGKYGTIAIRDADGFSHEILHTHSRHVAIGDPVAAGQIVGTMGNTGVDNAYIEKGQQHVHYQIRDPAGTPVNPIEFWDQQGRFDPAPPSPQHIEDYNRYLRSPGAVGTPEAMGGRAREDAGTPASFGASGQFMPGVASSSRPLYGTGRFVGPTDASADDGKDIRRLTRIVPKANLGGYDPNAATTAPNQMPSADTLPSFSDRFGNWTSGPSASGPLGPYQPVSPPPQAGNPVGIVSGQPMPDAPWLPPSVWGLPGKPAPGDEEWSQQQLKQARW